MMGGLVDRIGNNMAEIPHEELHAGNLHVRFDEGSPPKNGEADLRVAEGRAGVPDKGRSALLYIQRQAGGSGSCVDSKEYQDSSARQEHCACHRAVAA